MNFKDNFNCRCWLDKRSVPLPMQGTWKQSIPISLKLQIFYELMERTYYRVDLENDTLTPVKKHYGNSKYNDNCTVKWAVKK